MDTKRELWRIVRFGITGTLSSLIHYGVYCLVLLFAGYNIAYTAGYGTGLLFNYVLTTYFTFRHHATKRNAMGFVLSHIANYALEIALLNVFVWMGIGHLPAALLVLLVVVPVNFGILRFAVYANNKK